MFWFFFFFHNSVMQGENCVLPTIYFRIPNSQVQVSVFHQMAEDYIEHLLGQSCEFERITMARVKGILFTTWT